MSKIVTEVIEVLGVKMLNGTKLSEKVVAKREIDKIIANFSGNDKYSEVLSSFFKIMLQEYSAQTFNFQKQILLSEDISIKSMVQSLMEYR